MGIPKLIKVACFDIAVEALSKIDATIDKIYGDFNSTNLTIKIDMTSDNYKVVDSLLREINHAVFWSYGIESRDSEKRIVSTLATGMTQVFRDNPDLLGFMARTLAKEGGTDGFSGIR